MPNTNSLHSIVLPFRAGLLATLNLPPVSEENRALELPRLFNAAYTGYQDIGQLTDILTNETVFLSTLAGQTKERLRIALPHISSSLYQQFTEFLARALRGENESLVLSEQVSITAEMVQDFPALLQKKLNPTTEQPHLSDDDSLVNNVLIGFIEIYKEKLLSIRTQIAGAAITCKAMIDFMNNYAVVENRLSAQDLFSWILCMAELETLHHHKEPINQAFLHNLLKQTMLIHEILNQLSKKLNSIAPKKTNPSIITEDQKRLVEYRNFLKLPQVCALLLGHIQAVGVTQTASSSSQTEHVDRDISALIPQAEAIITAHFFENTFAQINPYFQFYLSAHVNQLSSATPGRITLPLAEAQVHLWWQSSTDVNPENLHLAIGLMAKMQNALAHHMQNLFAFIEACPRESTTLKTKIYEFAKLLLATRVSSDASYQGFCQPSEYGVLLIILAGHFFNTNNLYDLPSQLKLQLTALLSHKAKSHMTSALILLLLIKNNLDLSQLISIAKKDAEDKDKLFNFTFLSDDDDTDSDDFKLNLAIGAWLLQLQSEKKLNLFNGVDFISREDMFNALLKLALKNLNNHNRHFSSVLSRLYAPILSYLLQVLLRSPISQEMVLNYINTELVQTLGALKMPDAFYSQLGFICIATKSSLPSQQASSSTEVAATDSYKLYPYVPIEPKKNLTISILRQLEMLKKQMDTLMARVIDLDTELAAMMSSSAAAQSQASEECIQQEEAGKIAIETQSAEPTSAKEATQARLAKLEADIDEIIRNNANNEDAQEHTLIELLITKHGLHFIQRFVLLFGVNYTDRKGNSILHYAAYHDSRAILEYLLNDPQIQVNLLDSQLRTALHIACMQGNFECANRLMDASSNPSIRDKYKKTAIAYVEVPKIGDENSDATAFLRGNAKSNQIIDTIRLSRRADDSHTAARSLPSVMHTSVSPYFNRDEVSRAKQDKQNSELILASWQCQWLLASTQGASKLDDLQNLLQKYIEDHEEIVSAQIRQKNYKALIESTFDVFSQLADATDIARLLVTAKRKKNELAFHILIKSYVPKTMLEKASEMSAVYQAPIESVLSWIAEGQSNIDLLIALIKALPEYLPETMISDGKVQSIVFWIYQRFSDRPEIRDQLFQAMAEVKPELFNVYDETARSPLMLAASNDFPVNLMVALIQVYPTIVPDNIQVAEQSITFIPWLIEHSEGEVRSSLLQAIAKFRPELFNCNNNGFNPLILTVANQFPVNLMCDLIEKLPAIMPETIEVDGQPIPVIIWLMQRADKESCEQLLAAIASSRPELLARGCENAVMLERFIALAIADKLPIDVMLNVLEQKAALLLTAEYRNNLIFWIIEKASGDTRLALLKSLVASVPQLCVTHNALGYTPLLHAIEKVTIGHLEFYSVISALLIPELVNVGSSTYPSSASSSTLAAGSIQSQPTLFGSIPASSTSFPPVTPLLLAAKHGEDKLVKSLIEKGADLLAKNELGQTTLMLLMASDTYPTKLMGAILDKIKEEHRNQYPEVQIDRAGNNLLHYAVEAIKKLQAFDNIVPKLKASFLKNLTNVCNKLIVRYPTLIDRENYQNQSVRALCALPDYNEVKPIIDGLLAKRRERATRSQTAQRTPVSQM